MESETIYMLTSRFSYVVPESFRERLVNQWHDPSLMRWWLPNDLGYRPVSRNIRAFVDQRTMKPRTEEAQDLRDMKALFSKLNVDDVKTESG